MSILGRMAGKRILVVEDEYFIAKSLTRNLKTASADVVGPVATVADALDLVRAGSLDGAVLDVNLRGELVYPVADVLSDQGVPFIFATGYSPGAIPARYASVVRCEKPSEAEAIISALFARRSRLT